MALDPAQPETQGSELPETQRWNNSLEAMNQPKEARMKVKDVMHQGATWVGPETSVTDIAERMRNEDIGAIPVGENDRLIGMITDRDIVVRGLSGDTDPIQLSARDVMSKPIIWCNANEELDDAVQIMESKQIRRLPVVDENKRMVGILSLGDVAAKASPAICSETLRSVSAHHA
jgi:CBS domain-containing protein